MATPTRWTADDAARIRDALATGLTQRRASSHLGIPQGSFGSILARYPDAGATVTVKHHKSEGASIPRPTWHVESDESIRWAILDVIRATPGLDSRTIPPLLQQRGGRHGGLHEVQHVIGSLIRQGLVDAKQRSSGPRKWYDGIELTNAGRATYHKLPSESGSETIAPEDIVVPANPWDQEPAATGEVSSSETTVDPEPEQASWPVLDALRKRADERVALEAKAMAYLEAATALAAFDPERAAELQAQAESTIANHSMTRAEAEYLAYADAHEEAQQ